MQFFVWIEKDLVGSTSSRRSSLFLAMEYRKRRGDFRFVYDVLLKSHSRVGAAGDPKALICFGSGGFSEVIHGGGSEFKQLTSEVCWASLWC